MRKYNKKSKIETLFAELNTLRLIAFSIMAGILYIGIVQLDDQYVYSTMPVRIGLATLFLTAILATFFSEKARKNFSSILFSLGFPLLISFVIYVHHYRFEPTRAFGIVIMIATYGFIFNNKRFLLFNLVFHTLLLLYCFYQTKLPLVDAQIYVPLVLFTFAIFYFLTSSKIDSISAISEKEAIMSALFYNSPEAYLLYDYSTGKISACNSRMLALLGSSSVGQVSHQPANKLEFMQPILKKIPEILNCLSRSNTTWNEEIAIDAFKSYPIIVDVVINRLMESGTLLTMRFVDITHRRAMEDALQMMRFSIDQASEMVFWLDEKGWIVYANGAAHRFLKYKDGSLLNKNMIDVDVRFAQKAQTIAENTYFNAYDLIDSDSIYVGSTGDEILVDIGKNMLRYADKKVICLFARDITGRKENETALRNYAEKLKSSNNELEQFAYVVSHDLQAPLRMVVSYLQLLERHLAKQHLDETAKEYIGFAVGGSQRMGEMIQAILQYSRVNTQTLTLEVFNPIEALTIALDNLSVLIGESNADIQFGKMPNIRADKFRLTQVLQNLVGNALKYRKKDVKTIVRITCVEKNNEFEFSVSDNGIGIASEYHNKIFKIFQRLHAHPEYEGTGIGLSICQKIIYKHGGRIWLESQPNIGTTFYFTIIK